jgi:hypothetical protein
LQRFREVARLRLHLIKQTDVADCDHGLIGESLQQGNLFVAERLHFGAAERDCSNALTLAQKGYA